MESKQAGVFILEMTGDVCSEAGSKVEEGLLHPYHP
jgi:hypothetical protein